MVGCPPSGFARWQLSLCEVRHQPGGLGPREVHVHHRRELRASPSLRSEPQNLLPLCRVCHTTLHKSGTDMPSAPMVDRSTFAIRGIGNDGGTSEIPGFGEASGGVVFRMFLREPARNRRSSGRNRKLSSDHLAATLSIRISPRANRSAWRWTATARRFKSAIARRGFLSEVPTGKRSRLGQPNPHPKIVKLGNKSGHFLTAMKQGLDTTTTTHKRYLNKTTRSAVHKRSDAPRK